MLPGSTATGESNWREIPRFTPDYRVISLSIPPIKNINTLLESIITILDSEGIGRVRIIGASMGGAIAHWFIRKHPERVDKLVIMSLGMPNEATAKELRKSVLIFSLLPSPLIRRMFFKEADKLVSALPGGDSKLMSAYFRDLYTNDMNKKTIIGHFRLVANLAAHLSDLGLDKPIIETTPVLIINAADDDTVDEKSRNALYATYPNPKKVLFPSGGHILFDRREELFNVISEFIKDEEERI